MLTKSSLRALNKTLDGFVERATLILTAAILACALPLLLSGATVVLSTDGLTVYDTVSNITWLADFNLPAGNRFGLPLCSGSAIDPKTCVNASGSMSYQAAAAWVAAMNAANYLGHNNWQLPTTPLVDGGCGFIGPQNNSFGFNCSSSALGSLYYNSLGFAAPNTAVPIPNNTAGPFSNFQPYLYWSQSTPNNGTGYATFSFASGFQGSNTLPNYLYVLPMIAGKIPGTPVATGKGLQVNPGGQTVYDPVTNVTWLANANLAAINTFGLPACKTQSSPSPCVNQDGAMNWNSASQFIANMNAYQGAGYLGQSNWELPKADPVCDVSYICTATDTPFQELFYNQLGLSPGTPVVAAPNVAVGPFHNLQPYLYWACQSATIQGACGAPPAPNFEWSFSFGNGFQGTDVLSNDLYVTAYIPGARAPATGPEIAEVANAEGESPTIAPNTWLEIKGVNLAPAGDARIWQASDFTGTQMPTQLDKVSATVNAKSAYVYYISPTQINILTPPDAMNGPVQVVVTNGGTASAPFTAQAQALSPSFFDYQYNGALYVAAVHTSGAAVGPASLASAGLAPAKPGETIMLYANGFGPTTIAPVAGSEAQSGNLPSFPAIKIGGVAAPVSFAGLVFPGQFQFNVQVPASLPDGDQPIIATYNGLTTQAGILISVQH